LRKIEEKLLFPRVEVNKNKLSKEISGKTIVITGASYGIGEELSLLFSNYNVRLVLIARTKEKLDAIARRVETNGSHCTLIVADLYQESDVERVIFTLQDLPNGIDIFISNAGKSIMRSLEDSLDRYHDFTRTNSLNYLAPVRLSLALTPLLSSRNGQIVNVSAINVLLLPAPKWSAYQASKTAFDQWFRCNLPEWKVIGIRAKTIYLPLVRTRMILPNEKYKNYPAMEPEQAVFRIAKLIYSRSHYYKSWWVVFPQIGSFFGKYVWERVAFICLIRFK
jgi:short-subunit dehydrogenase